MMLSKFIQALALPSLAARMTDSSEVTVSGALLRTMLEGQFRDMRIDLCASGGNSSVSFPSALGLPPLHFRASGGSVVLRSQGTFVSLREPAPGSANGAIEMEIWLASADGSGKLVTLTVRLALACGATGATYDRVDVSCASGDESLDQLIRVTVEAFFYWAYTKDVISSVLRAAIHQVSGAVRPVFDVSVDQSRLVVWHRNL